MLVSILFSSERCEPLLKATESDCEKLMSFTASCDCLNIKKKKSLTAHFCHLSAAPMEVDGSYVPDFMIDTKLVPYQIPEI